MRGVGPGLAPDPDTYLRLQIFHELIQHWSVSLLASVLCFARGIGNKTGIFTRKTRQQVSVNLLHIVSFFPIVVVGVVGNIRVVTPEHRLRLDDQERGHDAATFALQKRRFMNSERS